MLLEQFAMFGDSAANTLAPHSKIRGLQLTTHHINNLFFRQSSALLDLFKRGAILLRIANSYQFFSSHASKCRSDSGIEARP